MMQKIRKGDEVIVIAGRDKGKRGTVTQRVDDRHLLVDGVNIVKKHVKPNPMRGTSGGVVDKSNVMLFNPTSGKGDRVGFKVLEDGRKVRVFKSNGEELKS